MALGEVLILVIADTLNAPLMKPFSDPLASGAFKTYFELNPLKNRFEIREINSHL